ncbi:MAG: glycosyltransferase family 61 protein [Nostoc sp.]|uniref:glycosyltransferase family 61 protein n=1 Tax=Nostoc sp. TaxID=1180 RepID=UPI002FFAB2C7
MSRLAYKFSDSSSAIQKLLASIKLAKKPFKWLRSLYRRWFFINQYVFAEQEAENGIGVKNVRIIHPAQRIHIADPDQDKFVSISKYYRDGWFDRPNIFVCEIPNAYIHVKTGLVCTQDFKAIADFGLEHRMGNYALFNGPKPILVRRFSGVYSTITYTDSIAKNFWHWMVDCLPKIHAMTKVASNTKIILLMPQSANEFQRETLRCILPENFEVSYIDGNEWIQTENLLWTSLVSNLCIGLLPKDYYEAVRNPVFKQFDLPTLHTKTERIYISRKGAKHRGVNNEDEVMELLEKFGFRMILLEELSFRQQVELFHRADIVVGPHGAGLGTIFFSGNIDVLVLYSTPNPPNYFHSLAKGLGQRHYFVCHNKQNEDDSFTANIPELERVLKEELRLKSQPEYRRV